MGIETRVTFLSVLGAVLLVLAFVLNAGPLRPIAEAWELAAIAALGLHLRCHGWRRQYRHLCRKGIRGRNSPFLSSCASRAARVGPSEAVKFLGTRGKKPFELPRFHRTRSGGVG
jgi:hypothetical protein